jgi:hypothetical protein
MAEEKIASIIRRRATKCQEIAQDVFANVETNRALYRGKIETDENYEWDYSFTDPHVFPMMRNYLSRSNPSHTKIRLEARKPDDYEKRQINQDFVNWELNELFLTSLFYRILYSGYMAGRGYAKTGWLYEPKIEIKTPDGRQLVMRDLINRADAKFVRFNDIVVPNRNIPTIHEQPYVIEYIQKSVGEMLDENKAFEEKGEKAYWDKSWLATLKKSGVEKQLLDYQIDFVQDEDAESETAFRSAYVSLICMRTKQNEVMYIPLKGDDKVVNTDQDNEFWHGHYPYIEFVPFPEDDEYYSMALVDTVSDLQIGASEVLNLIMTNIRQINNEMFIAGTSAAQTPDWQFQRRPNGIIRVAGDVSQIQQLRTQDNTTPSLRISEAIQNKIERASGISSLYASGAPGTSINQTARGAQIIDQNIDTNMRMILDLFGEQVIKTMGEHFLELNAQFVTEDQVFYVTGKKGALSEVKISPKVVTANLNVFVNAERMVKQTPASRQQSLQNLMGVVSAQANASGVQIDMVPLFEALLDSYPEMENIEDVVVSIDEKAKRDITMLERGQEVEIKVRDPHLELMQIVQLHYEDNAEMYPEEVHAVFGKYFVDHIRFMQKQREIMAMSQPQLPSPPSSQGMAEAMGSSEQMGLPENQRGYNLGSLIPDRSEI